MARPLTSFLSVALISLSVLLICLVLHAGRFAEQQLQRNIAGIETVVGAKGSPLQLILSAVFQIDDPTGNIPWEEAQRIAKIPLVKKAIPLAYGDAYQGVRIVGTDTAYLGLYGAVPAQGRVFEQTFEIVAGSAAAERLVLQIGQSFESHHGTGEEGEAHGHAFKVVGVLQATGTALDDLLITPVASIWENHGQHEGEGPLTAMILQFRSPLGLLQVPRWINEKTNMQAAIPSYEVHRLLKLLGAGITFMQALGACIMAVAVLSVWISLYNSLKERKYEMALLRQYGAPRWRLMQLVLQESIMLGICGFLLGIGLSRVLGFASIWVPEVRRPFVEATFLPEEAMLLGIVLLLCLFAALLPAIQVSKISISKTLSEA